MTPDIEIESGPKGKRLKIDLEPPEWLLFTIIVLTAFAAYYLSKVDV